MSLSWNEIKSRSLAFSKNWEGEAAENAEAKSFWDEFFQIFGVARRRVASFEKRVKKQDGNAGFIDLLWKGILLVEHKSRGKDLDTAYSQALDYSASLKERDFPRYIVVSDFARFRLHDLDEGTQHEFKLEDLHQNVNHFGFIAGYKVHKIRDEDPVNVKAAEWMGMLHDHMKEVGYDGHSLELYLVRLLFCMFAEDTGIFERRQFEDYIEDRTSEDGSDLAHHLSSLFHVLNTPAEKRLKNLDEHLAAFAYINGKLFEEVLPPASFDSRMRTILIECCDLDWGRLSPSIFGSLFQSTMDPKERRQLGAHYTNEKNILKLIDPLFMDELREEFEKAKTNKNKLIELHNKLQNLTFLDPACGCGNFLVIAYRELRLLELDILRALNKSGQLILDIKEMIKINIDQFYGIEIEEFPAQIAQVAMWLVDHQMNLLVSQEFGMYFTRIPLQASAQITNKNALRFDWNELIPVGKLNYIFGNPPFVGQGKRTKEQTEELQHIFNGFKGVGNLDYISCWYIKAAELIKVNNNICAAFVSTNSITQGIQVNLLWERLLSLGMTIHFAHRTFGWSSEGKGKAAIHCVIIGFGSKNERPKRLFEYDNINGDPLEIENIQINPYLVDAPTVLIPNRKNPIANINNLTKGSQPTDGGYLLLSIDEKNKLKEEDHLVEKYIRTFLGAREFIHNQKRYCLWLCDCPPNELRQMKGVLARVEKVREFRAASRKAATRRLAMQPTLFGEIRQPVSDFLVVPEVSGERRMYIPIGYVSKYTICGNVNYFMEGASLYDFGIITSLMHMSWARAVCGRLESRYRYSVGTVYNNFPWPLDITEKHKRAIEERGQAVLDARAEYHDSSLADLYDPLTMPPVLLKAHHALDKAVDLAYGKKDFPSEAARVAFLFELYQHYTSTNTTISMEETKPVKKRAKKKKSK